MKYLLAANGPDKLQPKFDTSLRMTAELLKRGIGVDYLNQDSFDPFATDPHNFLHNIPVQKITQVNLSDSKGFLVTENSPPAAVTDYQVILQRLDPPVNDFFKAHARLFEKTPSHILQINNPRATPIYSEHALPLKFAKYATPTRICENLSQFQQALALFSPGESVAKPYDECSGNGIEFLKPETPDETLKNYLAKWGPKIVVQKFIPEISTLGDLRILMINQKILGSVTRIPAKGSRLGNLHQGATAKAQSPTSHQIEASLKVAADLAAEGLHLLGLDFIGDFLNEVNITSPSALVQVNEVSGVDHFPKLIDEIESLRQKQSHS